MLLCQDLESPPFVRSNLANFKNNPCQTCNLFIRRLGKDLQTLKVLGGNVRLSQKPKNLIHLFKMFPRRTRKLLTFLTDMISVALAGKSLIGSLTMTNSTVVAHRKNSSLFRITRISFWSTCQALIRSDRVHSYRRESKQQLRVHK